jgi:hypothetical protein
MISWEWNQWWHSGAPPRMYSGFAPHGKNKKARGQSSSKLFGMISGMDSSASRAMAGSWFRCSGPPRADVRSGGLGARGLGVHSPVCFTLTMNCWVLRAAFPGAQPQQLSGRVSDRNITGASRRYLANLGQGDHHEGTLRQTPFLDRSSKKFKK